MADAPTGDAPGDLDPTATPPAPTPTTVIDPDESDALRESGKKALDAERVLRSTAEKSLKTLQAELDKVTKERMTEQERAVTEAREEGRTEAIKPMHDALVRAEVKAAAKGVMADPRDAHAFLGDLNRFITDGVVDDAAIDKAIAALVKEKPYLRSQQGPGSIDGGTRPPAPAATDMNALIRQQRDARRGVAPARG